MSGVSFKLYLITDRRVAAPRSLEDVVAAALSRVAPGEAAVQVREKDLSPHDLLLLAERLAPIVHAAGGLLFVNDRADVARAAGADGVHLGGGAIPVAAARAAFPGAIIGVSTHTAAEAAAAAEAGADFVVAGPVHRTPGKPAGTVPMGTSGFAGVCRAAAIPVLALGGMDSSNARAAVEAGGAGVALIRAVMGAKDPGLAAREILDTMKTGGTRC